METDIKMYGAWLKDTSVLIDLLMASLKQPPTQPPQNR